MKRVLIAENIMEANLVMSILEEEHIIAFIDNNEVPRGLGTLPTIIGESPTIWVDDSNYEKAVEVLKRYKKGNVEFQE